MRTPTIVLLVSALLVPTVTSHAQDSPAKDGEIILKQLDDHLYQTEHALFIIDAENRLGWPDWLSVFAEENLFDFADELHAHFPDSFMTITVSAANLEPQYTPRYLPFGPKPAAGIGRGGTYYEQDFCIHPEAGDYVTNRALAVFDHEIGHAWGVYLPFEERGHWPLHSTVYGQMSRKHSLDNSRTIVHIVGDESEGFSWRSDNNSERNRRQIFSDQHLYVMGLEPRFPDTYVLRDPVYQPDSTVSYSSFTKYTHDDVVAMVGPREPGYATSPKQFRIAFVFVARSLAEVESTYEGFEEAIRHFTYSREISPVSTNVRVPFLVLTKMRASVSSRLSDLDGNASPHVAVHEPYLSVGVHEPIEIPFEATDPDGMPLEVQCLGTSCRAEAGRILVDPIAEHGTYFYTVHARDAGGKEAYAHFVLDVTAGPLPHERPQSTRLFSLQVPYPHPFRTSTTFKVNVDRSGPLELHVYDLSGRRVAEIGGGWYPPGRHELIWDASNLPSGAYLVKAMDASGSGSRMVTLIK